MTLHEGLLTVLDNHHKTATQRRSKQGDYGIEIESECPFW
jgi:hypothetical protein